MSAEPDSSSGTHLRELTDIPTDEIDRNPKNPRIYFTQEEMDRLTESIDRKGILVPIVVYRDGDRYVLIDGERRWRCATALGLPTVPAVITDAVSDEENLVQMFNIHMVREAWKDMPTARALGELIEETGTESDKELSDLTGLSTERIKRLRHALELPPEYQTYIDEGRIPLNFFWELKRNVIDPLAKKRPALAAEFGENEVLDAFVEKRLREVITDTVSLRQISPIITFAARDVEDLNDPSPLDDTIRSLVKDPDVGVQEAYEDTVQVVFEAEQLQRRSDNVIKGFQRLLARARTPAEINHVKGVGRSLVDRLVELIK
jgi:ParB family transcriptional regulator, chromosome partitioning protein